MLNLFRKKSRLEKLKVRYQYLMRRSFEMSLKDAEKSERIHREADELYKEIKQSSYQS